MVCKLTFGVPPGRKYWCFNPCYVGLWSVSFAKRLMKRGIGGFNPCYVGLWSVSPVWLMLAAANLIVSILVMLDYGL